MTLGSQTILQNNIKDLKKKKTITSYKMIMIKIVNINNNKSKTFYFSSRLF